MNKIIFIAFALALTAQAACPNYLGTQLTLTPQAAAGGEIAFTASENLICASLSSATKSCCTAAIVNGKKGDADTLVTTLEGLAGTKDTAILAARKKIADLFPKFVALSAAYTDAVKTKLTSLATNDATAVKTFLDDYIPDINTFFSTYGTLWIGFTTYQNERAACLTELVKAQVTGWCLGCDTDYLTKGVAIDGSNVPTVTYAPAFLTTLREQCYDYFVASAQQTDILRLAHFAAPVETYTAGLVKLANADNTDDAAAVTSIKDAIPAGSAAGISVVPSGCTASTCAFIESDLIPQLVLDNTKAILGGSTPSRRRLQQSQNRMLAGTFTSSGTENKVAYSVKANPANVVNVNDLSALRVGVFSCIVAFFVALLI